MIYYDKDGYTPTCNYYVQQMFAQNQGDYVLSASLEYKSDKEDLSTFTVGNAKKGIPEKTESSLYYNATVDSNGDIIIKIVNANTKQDISVGLNLSGISYENNLEVTVLQDEDSTATNAEGHAVEPQKSTIDAGNGLAYTAKKNSVAVIRIKTK